MLPRHRFLTCAALVAALGLATTASSQSLSVRSVEIAPSLWSYVSLRPVALSATSVLLPSNGPDDSAPPADRACEVTLLVEDLDRDPKVTPLATPSSAPCRQNLRLSPTRALLFVDEGLYLMDDLGGSNRVLHIELDLPAWAGVRPVRLDDETAVVITSAGVVPQSLLLLSDLGGAVRITETPGFSGADGLAALGPRDFLVVEAYWWRAWHFHVEEDGSLTSTELELDHPAGGVVVLSPTSFLYGFDPLTSVYAYRGDDDGVYLFTDLGGSNRRTALATPGFASPREVYETPALTRLSTTRAILPSPGPDGVLGNDDDRVLVLDDLGGQNEVVTVSTPGLTRMEPIRIRRDRALLAFGASAPFTLAALLDIGGSNLLGPSSSPLPMLSFWSADVLPVGDEAALVVHAGTTQDDPDDDAAEWISGLTAIPQTEPLPLTRIGSSRQFELTALGNGRAFKSDWVEPLYWPDGPHHLYVLEGLGGLTLEAERVSLRFHREYGASLRATARLLLPEPADLAASDLTVRIGNAWQTIPAAAIEATPTGYLYHDPKGRRGFLRRLEYDAAAGSLFLKGRGFKTRARTTRPDNLVLSLEGLFLYAAQSLDGTKRGDMIVYRAP